MPLQRTINIILDHAYNNKLIATRLKGQTLEKLIKDTCSKTIFSTNNKFYQQIDGVSMGSSLGLILASIIMTEMEETIIKKLIDDKILLFFGQYVNDKLVVMKKKQKQKNKTHKTCSVVSHFLGIKSHPDRLSIYCKDTNIGQYTHYSSYSP